MFVENINNTEYWNKEDSISLVLLHELQHYSSISFPNTFFSIHKQSITLYYKKVLDTYFGVDISEPEAMTFAKWLHNSTETQRASKNSSGNFLNHYANNLYRLLKPIYKKSDEELKSNILKYVLIIKMYLDDPKEFLRKLYSHDEELLKFYTCFYRAYSVLKIRKLSSVVIQESCFPSEIVCIESEYNTSNKHFILIPKIK